jgi:enoyl-CoA hydratase
MPSELSYEEQGHVGVITLQRPEARNALTYTTYAELEDAVRTTTARCLVITGADPAFCSGDDVKQIMARTPAKGGQAGAGDRVASGLQSEPRLTPAADALLHTDVPVVAAVNGAAVGWGMELAVMADIRVASEKAKFGELFVKRGLCCDAPGLGRLAQLVGRERAAELLFTGRIVDADEAKEIGLVSRVVPHDELMPTALELAQSIASNPPLAVQRLKRGLREALDPDWQEVGRWVTTTLAELFRTEDHREGVASFLEKREPNYVGR